MIKTTEATTALKSIPSNSSWYVIKKKKNSEAKEDAADTEGAAPTICSCAA